MRPCRALIIAETRAMGGTHDLQSVEYTRGQQIMQGEVAARGHGLQHLSTTRPPPGATQPDIVGCLVDLISLVGRRGRSRVRRP